MKKTKRAEGGRWMACTLLMGFLLPLLVAPPGASAQDEPQTAREVGQLPLLEQGTSPTEGWLILNSARRRAYQVFRGRGGNSVVWSVDLDTLEPIRRVQLTGFTPLETGNASLVPWEVFTTSGQGGSRVGEVLHALDDEGGRLLLVGLRRGEYLGQVGIPLDRTVFVASIDGAKLDAGEPDFVRYLPVPATQVAQLRGRIPLGATFVGNGSGKLLIMFGSPGDGLGAGEGFKVRHVYDHWLAQWDVATGAGDWVHPLDLCGRASVQSQTLEPPASAYQLPILRAPSAIYLTCQATHGVGQVVKIPLLANGAPDVITPSQAFPVPRTYINALADPASERLFVQVSDGLSWWTFDGRTGTWAGATGMPQPTTSSAGLDSATGRLYVLVSDGVVGSTPIRGGLLAMEGRLGPPGQLNPLLSSLAYHGIFKILVDPATPERARRLFVRRGHSPTPNMRVYPGTQASTPAPVENFYRLIEDPTPPVEQPPSTLTLLDQNTVDRLEEPEVTGANFEAVASAYGLRLRLLGGLTAATSRELEFVTTPCYEADREVIVGAVATAQLNDNTASARSVSLHADDTTKDDPEKPTTRCPPIQGQEVPNSETIDALIGEPWDQNGDGEDDYTVECAGDDSPEPATPPRSLREYRSEAECAYSSEWLEASSLGAVSLSGAGPPASVAAASSEVRLERDNENGTVVTVEATARGIEITGVGYIDVVRTTARTFAHGRPETARTEFSRIICGVRLPNLVREPCGEVGPVVTALNRILGRNGQARLRNPDPEYEDGSKGGYQAAIRRDQLEAFQDEVIEKDTSKAVPGLEIIFYRGDSGSKGAGRQIFQFAAVEASSAYGISCLFGFAPQGSADPCVVPTSELNLLLTDGDGNPLAGGVFEVHVDQDADGILGVDDPILNLGSSNATCTTGEDGIGDCNFILPPGDYVVHETSPPPGYATATDCAVSLARWSSTTCTFQNLEAVGMIDIGLTDEDDKALPGGSFQLFADDGDGKLGPADLKLASCTTGEQGACLFRTEDIKVSEGIEIASAEGSEETSGGVTETVAEEGAGEGDEAPDEGTVLIVPLGNYLVHEAKTPDGYLPSEDEPVTMTLPGDAAHIRFVNGQKGKEPQGGSFQGTEGTSVTTIIIEEGSPAIQPVATTVPFEPSSALPPEGPIQSIVRAPARALLFLLRHPMEAVLIGGMWLLLIAPVWIAWRRRSLSLLEGVGA